RAAEPPAGSRARGRAGDHGEGRGCGAGRRRMDGRGIEVVLLAAAVAACTPAAEQEGSKKPANNTIVLGIDVSGSFRDSRLYDDAVEFAGLYIYAHLNGLGGLRVPTAVFVSSVGGVRTGEPKSLHPIHDFEGRAMAQIAADIRNWFP